MPALVIRFGEEISGLLMARLAIIRRAIYLPRMGSTQLFTQCPATNSVLMPRITPGQVQDGAIRDLRATAEHGDWPSASAHHTRVEASRRLAAPYLMVY